MAKLSQGILGGISGKIGNVIGSSWKGISVVKSKPLSVSNPRTASQIAQRSKMFNIVSFSKVILSAIIKPHWDRFAQKQSGYNAFVSQNIALFATKFASTPADLVVSQGKMVYTQPTLDSVSIGLPDVVIAWADDSGEGFKLADDEASVILVNRTQEVVNAYGFVANRDDATANLATDYSVADGDVFDIYLVFKRKDGTVVSNTGYATFTAS